MEQSQARKGKLRFSTTNHSVTIDLPGTLDRNGTRVPERGDAQNSNGSGWVGADQRSGYRYGVLGENLPQLRGLFSHNSREWFDFYASYNTGAALVRWRDGTSTQEEVSRLARPPLPILGRGVTWSEPRTIDTVRYDLVLLSPTASSVVIHELIGHGCEHFREKIVGLRVGPEELRVVAFPKNGSGFDDEGTPSEEIVLVENGIVRHAVRDRATGGMAPFSGLTKVASHGVNLAQDVRISRRKGNRHRKELPEYPPNAPFG